LGQPWYRAAPSGRNQVKPTASDCSSIESLSGPLIGNGAGSAVVLWAVLPPLAGEQWPSTESLSGPLIGNGAGSAVVSWAVPPPPVREVALVRERGWMGPWRGHLPQVSYQHDLFPRWRPATFTLVSTPSGAGLLPFSRRGRVTPCKAVRFVAGFTSTWEGELKSCCLMAAGNVWSLWTAGYATVPIQILGGRPRSVTACNRA